MVIGMKDIIEKYRGNYIAEMRKIVGHAPLRTIGCGVIIENDKGKYYFKSDAIMDFGQSLAVLWRLGKNL